jgi:hypothetical protein
VSPTAPGKYRNILALHEEAQCRQHVGDHAQHLPPKPPAVNTTGCQNNIRKLRAMAASICLNAKAYDRLVEHYQHDTNMCGPSDPLCACPHLHSVQRCPSGHVCGHAGLVTAATCAFGCQPLRCPASQLCCSSPRTAALQQQRHCCCRSLQLRPWGSLSAAAAAAAGRCALPGRLAAVGVTGPSTRLRAAAGLAVFVRGAQCHQPGQCTGRSESQGRSFS